MRSQHPHQAVRASQLGLVLNKTFSRDFLPKVHFRSKNYFEDSSEHTGPECTGKEGVMIFARSLLPH